jgi:hypothetical protein
MNVRVDYLDRQLTSFNLDSEVKSSKKFVLNQLISFKGLANDVNAKDSKAVLDRILARKNEFTNLVNLHPEYKTVMLDEVHTLKKIIENV